MADRSLTAESDDSGSESGGEFGGRRGNDNDFSFGESYDSAGGAALQQMRLPGGPGGAQAVADKPYDMAIDVGGSDAEGESDISTPDNSDDEGGSPKQVNMPASSVAAAPAAAKATPSAQPAQSQASAPAAARDEESSSESDSSDGEEDQSGASPSASSAAKAGAYNAAEYDTLPVGADIKELFQYISRYKPHDIELDTSLKPFVPDLVPCIGEVDAFLKIPAPDGKPDGLGTTRLDEPCLCPSDPSVLDLQLRSLSKRADIEPMEVRSIEDAAKNPKEIKNWIDRVGDLHRQKPAPIVQYSARMPDIEQLMQVWPIEFEEHLANSVLPELAGLDMDLRSFVKFMAVILDVPVYSQITETLHVIFTLYSEFKSNQHFAQAGLHQHDDAQRMAFGTLDQTLGVVTLDGTMNSSLGLGASMPYLGASGAQHLPDPGWGMRVPSPKHAG